MVLKVWKDGDEWAVWALTEDADDPTESHESFIVGTGVDRVSAMFSAARTFQNAVFELRKYPRRNTIHVEDGK